MKKISVVFFLLGILVLLSSSRSDEPDSCGDGVSRKSGGPPSCYAGEPPLLTTCQTSGCHEDFPLNTGTVQLHLYLGGADSAYIPGQFYTITVSISRPGMVRGGFQITALQDNHTSVSPGLYFLTDTVRTQVIDAFHSHSGGCPTQNKVWIEHTGNGIDQVAGDSIKWQYRWKAPSTNVGTITFYLAAVDANMDLDNTGDHVYSLTKQIPAAVGTSVEAIDDVQLSIFPNPANSFLEIQVGRPVLVSIWNVTGQEVLRQRVAQTTSIDISNFRSGIYFICDSEKKLLGKFVKQ
jgi:hypothetical protein